MGPLVICLVLTAKSRPAANRPAEIGQFAKPSVTRQIELGEGAAREIRKREKILPATDPRVIALRRVAMRVLASFDTKDVPAREMRWEFSFDVIDSKEINAFALPGGPTFFFSGLMDRLRTEDEIAAVLGHELSHVRFEHWARSYRDEENRDVLMTVGALVLRANRDITNAAGVTATLGFELPYSRRHETEADDGGYGSMVQAGYNPAGMADVFRMLGKTAADGHPPEWLSDHPADKNRVERVEAKIKVETHPFPPQTPLDYPSKPP